MNDRNWGGKRAGAGRRKNNTEYKTFSVVLPVKEAELLKRIAKNHDMTVSRFISKYLQLAETVEIEKSGNEGENQL